MDVRTLRFKLKYHPEESVKRREELKAALMKRVQVFKDFWSQKAFDGVAADGDKSDALVKVLDSVVIMLEGGDENDLKVGTELIDCIATTHGRRVGPNGGNM